MSKTFIQYLAIAWTFLFTIYASSFKCVWQLILKLQAFWIKGTFAAKLRFAIIIKVKKQKTLYVFLENFSFINRGIKTSRTIKTKLPLQFCMNSLTIIMHQLGLVFWPIGRQGERCKLTNRSFDNEISIKEC